MQAEEVKKVKLLVVHVAEKAKVFEALGEAAAYFGDNNDEPDGYGPYLAPVDWFTPDELKCATEAGAQIGEGWQFPYEQEMKEYADVPFCGYSAGYWCVDTAFSLEYPDFAVKYWHERENGYWKSAARFSGRGGDGAGTHVRGASRAPRPGADRGAARDVGMSPGGIPGDKSQCRGGGAVTKIEIDELLQSLRPSLREETRAVLARWHEPRYCGRAHLMGMRDRPGTRPVEKSVFNQLLQELGPDGFCEWYANEFGVPVGVAVADNDGACR